MNAGRFTHLLCVLLIVSGWTANAQKVELKITNYPIPSTGTVIYAAPEDASLNPGNTTNTGTSISSPWTLTKALLDAPANATVILRGGEYRSLSQGRITNKITIQAYPGEEPWIKGSVVVTGWEKVDGMEVWVHSNWPYQFPKNTVAQNIGTNPLCDNRDMVFINDQSLTQVDSLAKVNRGEFFVDYAGDKLYIGTNPSAGRIESTRFVSPIMRNNASGAEIKTPSGTTIKGIGFTHFSEEGLEVVCLAGLRLEDNTFSWNGVAGASLVAPTAVIRGNTFAFNGNVGMKGNNLKETVVEDNHAYENNIERYSVSWAAAGIKVVATKKMMMRRNTLENNYCNGVWLDISAIDNELTYNTINNNNGFGIFSELSNGTIVAGNLLIDNKNFAVAIADGDSSEVWNNTIVTSSGRGFFLKDSPREARAVAPGTTYYSYVFSNLSECSWITRANVFKNNIVITNSSHWMENTPPSALQVRESDYNGYYRTATTDGNVYKWNNVNYTSLDNFRTAVPGYETNSIAFYAQTTPNPYFSDTTCRVKASSPAIKAGAPLPANIAVLLGLPVNNDRVDMGAIQTVSPAAPTDLAATKVSQTQIDLTWKDNADNETGFIVERKWGLDSAFTVIDTTAADIIDYSSTGLTANTTYTYRVTAYNSAGDSAYSNEASATTLPVEPLAPTNLTATVQSQQTIALSWTDNADNEEGYRVERTTDSVFATLANLGANATAYKETGLVAGTTYKYRVIAYNTGGSSSAEVTATTLAAGTGLLATYYKSKFFLSTSLSRIDTTINFNWGTGSPEPSLSSNTFSVRWEGQIETKYSETYSFKTVTDDGVRVWVNGQLLIDDFKGFGQRTNTGTITLEGDKRYSIKVEYFENSGNALAQLYWISPSQGEQIIPKSHLYPAAPAPTYGSLNEIMEVKLFPNPASGFTTLGFNAKQGEHLLVKVLSKENVVVLTYTGTAIEGENKITLNISSLQPGIYAVVLQRGNTLLPKLLIVR